MKDSQATTRSGPDRSSDPLRVLMVHNRYRVPGGEDVCADAEVDLLREQGHVVEAITKDNHTIPGNGSVGAAANAIWSRSARREVYEILRDGRFDLLHVQNFFPQFSPSIYYAAREAGVPIVQTLHNYRLLCPGATFYRDGKPCEKCIGRRVAWPALMHACYRDSRRATAAVAAMTAVHGTLGTWTRHATLLIALSRFAREKMIEGGLPAEKIVVKPNFVFPDPGFEERKDDCAIFVGRLSPEKGVQTLLEAWQRISTPLRIVGDGPLKKLVAEAAVRMHHVEYLGSKSLKETYELIGRSRLLVAPSESYETFGRVVAEAFSRGTPVLASGLGALAELVDPGRTGAHFTTRNAHDLAARVRQLMSDPEQLERMGRAARGHFENHYSAPSNYVQLMAIYRQAIESGMDLRPAEDDGREPTVCDAALDRRKRS